MKQLRAYTQPQGHISKKKLAMKPYSTLLLHPGFALHRSRLDIPMGARLVYLLRASRLPSKTQASNIGNRNFSVHKACDWIRVPAER